MRKLKTKDAGESFLRRMRRQRLKSITILPSLITILNGICGFAAIVFASKGVMAGVGQFSYHKLTLPYFAMSGYMILLAMIADMLDGRVARMSKATSSFGGQLDSLCDIISFGIAPAFLMLEVLQYKFNSITEINVIFKDFLLRFVWLTAAAYISCAAIRLARFNVENEEDASSHMSFIGLPSPGAAGVIASLVIFHQEVLPDLAAKNAMVYKLFENAITYALPFITLSVAILMVSRIRYPHVLNQYVRGKKPFAHLIKILIALGLVIWCRQIALAVVSCSFAASGFVRWFYSKVIRQKSKPAQQEPVKSPAPK